MNYKSFIFIFTAFPLLCISYDDAFASIGAEITEYNIVTKSIIPGEKFETQWKVKALGTEDHVYYFGFSVKPPSGKWVDFNYWSYSLSPGEEITVYSTWGTPTNVEQGYYLVRMAVWAGVDKSFYPHQLLNRLDYIDIKDGFRIDNTQRSDIIIQKPSVAGRLHVSAFDSGPYKNGEYVVVQPTVENQGLYHTFYIKYSVKDKFGNWWDAPSMSLTLMEDQSGSIPLKWQIPDNAPPGWYTARIGVSSIDQLSSTHDLIDMIDHVDIEKAFQVGEVVAVEEEKKLEDENLIDEAKLNGGCLIATATYGSELAPQVQFLREIRDNTVLSTASGASFMTAFNSFYYSFSPTVADLERQNPVFKEAVNLSISPMLLTLSILQYVDIDSEGKMLIYGIGIILLNIAIYIWTPIFTIKKLRIFRS